MIHVAIAVKEYPGMFNFDRVALEIARQFFDYRTEMVEVAFVFPLQPGEVKPKILSIHHIRAGS